MKDAAFSSARLLELYDRISDAEDAIPRLRRFVLDLAVRGKLVEQDASDEPAAELLKRIAQKKAKGKKNAAELPKAESPEALGKIPSSWKVVPLIGIGSWAIGSGFPKNEQGIGDGPYFFLKVSDMNLEGNEKFITVSNNYIDDDAAQRMRAKIHPAGTIIFPKIGGAIATNKRRILTREAAIDNNCLGITFASEVNLDWAFLLMTSIDLTEYQVGTAVPALQQGVLEKIAVALPPLAEQHRIVAKVDELMALCDQLEQARAEREAARDRLTTASLARLTAPDTDTFQSHARFALHSLPTLTTRPDQIKTLRQTILNLAVRGKLVEQDAADEPAAELLARIASERVTKAKGVKVRTKRPIADADGDGSTDLPEGWALQALGNLVDPTATISYGVLVPGPDVEDGVPFVRAQDLSLLGHAPRPNKTIAPEIEAPFARTRLKGGEILLCVVGSIGKLGIAPASWAGANIARAVVRIAPVDSIASAYLLLTLQSDVIRIYFTEATRTVAQPTLNVGLLEVLPIALPPLAEQHRIVAKVDALMALCEQMEASLTTTATTRSKLLNALLHEALEPATPELEAAE